MHPNTRRKTGPNVLPNTGSNMRYGRTLFAALLAFALLPALACQTGPRARRVAVMDFTINLPDGEMNLLTKSIPDTLTASLANEASSPSGPIVDVIERATVEAAALKGKPWWRFYKLRTAPLQDVGKRIGADYLIVGSLNRYEGVYVLNSRLFSVATANVVPETAIERSFDREEDIVPSLQSVARSMAHQVRQYEMRVQMAQQAYGSQFPN